MRISELKNFVPKKPTEKELSYLRRDDLRRAICEHSFRLFFFAYFGSAMTNKMTNIHYVMIEMLKFKGFDFLLWVMFRGSSKTTLCRAYCVWCVVYKKKWNIHWIADDLKKAEKNARGIGS